MISTTTSDWTVQPAQFRAYHGAALEHDEVRHGLILNALAQVENAKPIDLSCWTLVSRESVRSRWAITPSCLAHLTRTNAEGSPIGPLIWIIQA